MTAYDDYRAQKDELNERWKLAQAKAEVARLELELFCAQRAVYHAGEEA